MLERRKSILFFKTMLSKRGEKMEQVSGANYKKGLWIFLKFFIVFLFINIIMGRYFSEIALYHEIFDILIPCFIYLLVTKKPILSTLKLNKKLNIKSVGIIFQLFLISFLLKFGINYLTLLTGQIDPSKVTTRVMEMVPNLLILFIAVAILPSFLEEIIIRGIVLNKFTDTTLWQGAVMTGLLFGFMHVDLGQFGYTTALGVIMAAIVISTGSLWGSILFHFLNNFLAVLFLWIYQNIGKFIPKKYSDVLSDAEHTQAIVQNNLLEKIYGSTIAIVCLGLGIFLTIHYVKKLKAANNNGKEINKEVVQETRVEIGCQQDRQEQVAITWKNLFLNIPFLFIVLIYVGINMWILR